MQVIRAEELTRRFGATLAVDRLSLQVEAGTIFGLLGPNGSGKTTTIRLLLGLLLPTSGRAIVLGYDTRSEGDAIRTRAGALLDYSGLYERLTAEDNLEFYGRVWHLPAEERRWRIKELLTHVGLWERRKETVGGWSRGMRQRLAIARALLHRPPLVFLDEPSAGLDPVAALELGRDLTALATREGVTVFLTTHNLAEAERLCDQVGIIRQGRLLVVGAPRELGARLGTARVEIVARGVDERLLARLRERSEVAAADLEGERLSLSLRGEASVAPLLRLLVEAGAEVEEVSRRQSGLAEVYLRLVGEQQA